MMQVRNKIGVKILNLTPTPNIFYPIPASTPTPENFDFVTLTPPELELESGFGVQCRALERRDIFTVEKNL